MKIEWLGHDAFRITEGDTVVYIDPFKIEGGPTASLVLVTHDHFDHLSANDLERIRGEGTVIAAPPGSEMAWPYEAMGPGEERELAGLKVATVPSYNVDKKFHPKDKGWVGYLLTIGGQVVYHAGDTDHIPEMDGIVCDIALLPVSGTYVMTATEAAEAARDIRPRVKAIPMHYDGGVVGTREDAERFAQLLEGSGIEVEILDKSS